MSSISEALATAVSHHQAGRLQAAEQMYRQILQSEPDNPDALHLLGVIAHQVNRHDVAIELICRSIQLNGDSPHVHNNLGGVYRSLQRFAEAETCFRAAVQLDPDYVDAYVNLAHALSDQGLFDEAIQQYRNAIELKPTFVSALVSLAGVFTRLDRLDESIECYDRILELTPDDAETRTNLGNALKSQGRLEDAVICYRKILEARPDFVVGLINLGVVLHEQSHVDEAISHFRRAIEIDGQSAEAHNNLGVAMQDQSNVNEAIDCFRTAIHLKPDYADAYVNLGNSLNNLGRLDEAVSCYQSALELQPDFAKAHSNWGVALMGLGQSDEAIACYRRAIELDPNYSEAFSNLGSALKGIGKLDEAVVCCRRAIDLSPQSADAYNHLGNALKEQGKLDEALKCYRRAVELKPNFANAHSNLVYTRLFCPGHDGHSLFEEHRRWNEIHAFPFAKETQAHLNEPSPSRRLRIGYVSPDFRNHVIGRSILPLFREHDHQQFEIFCYSDVSHPDEMTGVFQASADVWHTTTGLPDSLLAEKIRDDQIDILVDLTLHMAQNRLQVFARKPAPVQVTFAGYPGTTGLTTIDYRLTDEYLDPPGLNEGHYSEESIRLPDSFWCFDALDRETVVSTLPVLDNGFVTFGCLNNFCKVNVPILKLWARVLNSVDGSRLMMLSGEGEHRTDTLNVFLDEGVTRDRVTFVPHTPRHQYLRKYHGIDIGLDTAPYNGHMTSLDSFWMGVPVVTLVGATVAGRAGLCQLMNLGLPDLIADTPERYVQIATDLAQNLPRLIELRATLRDRMKASPLMDQKRFARNLESAYREMWERWC